ncbi:MAG TPA: galactokinase family protein [Isosphaeraceae bacterium]|jgi:L-arabinokinase
MADDVIRSEGSGAGVHERPGLTPDYWDFAHRLRASLRWRLPVSRGAAAHFTPDRPVVVARAPGRLDVLGGIADYSGALVLQWPIRAATLVAAQEADDDRVRMTSLADPAPGSDRSVVLARGELDRLAEEGYAAAREFFARAPQAHWSSYAAGALIVLARERRARCPRGLRLLIRSDVPQGQGLSSSAALEVATMQALAHLLGVALGGAELARLCQKVENLVVGAPCGIMDQMASALGRANHLLALVCQPAEVLGFVRPPEGIEFWGIDSGIRHAVSGADYVGVRTGAFMGYRILAEAAGAGPPRRGEDGVVRYDDPPWGGYLANLDPGDFERTLAGCLPEAMRGDEFLRRYGGTTDPVTRVDPGRTYAIRRPTAHPIHEHARVLRFAAQLAAGPDEPALREMGALMDASHASYSACGLGSAGTDRLVELVRRAGPGAGLYGAKITGGGSGGTAAVLGRSDAEPAVLAIARQYGEETGHAATVFSGSSPGACAFGVRVLAGPGGT